MKNGIGPTLARDLERCALREQFECVFPSRRDGPAECACGHRGSVRF
jgi:hypothetical protein